MAEGKKAFITGITGQDGSYLAEHLLSRGYEVHGMVRRSSTFNRGRIDHLWSDPQLSDTRLFLHYGDLTDSGSMARLLVQIQPQAEARGFLYCHPDGTLDPFGYEDWNATDACCDFYNRGVDDAGYLRGLIEEMSRRFAVDPKRVGLLISDAKVPPEQLEAWKADQTSCIVGKLTADHYKLKIGDRLQFTGQIYPCDLELEVVGIYQGKM